VYPFPADQLNELAYYFHDVSGHGQDPRELDDWLSRLRLAARKWMERNRAADGGVAARLAYAGDDSGSVYDSRSGQALTYRLAPEAHHLLRLLDTPKTSEALGRATGWDRQAISTHLEELRQHRLLFEEDHKCLSLVTQPVRDGCEASALAASVAT